MQELQAGIQQGQPGDHGSMQGSNRNTAQMQFPLPCWALTLFVSSKHPNLDVGQCQEGNSLWNPLLQLVLNGCCTQQLKIQGLLARESQVQAILAQPQPILVPSPSCHSRPPRRCWPAYPPGCPGLGWLAAVFRPTPHSTLHPDPCRPVPVSSALPLHTPGDRVRNAHLRKFRELIMHNMRTIVKSAPGCSGACL